MIEQGATFSQIEAIRAVLGAALAELHHTLPGRVVSYNPTRQTIAVQPVVRVPVINELGVEEMQEHPTLPAVPVRFPCGAGYVFIFPLAPGDHVDLHFCDVDPTGWRASGQTSDPVLLDRNSLNFAYATPGARPATSPVADAPSARMVLGRENEDVQIRIDASNIELGRAATDFVALASKVDDALEALQKALDGHTHNSAAPGTPGGPPIPLPLVIPPATVPVGTLSSVASTVVKSR